MFSFNRQNPEVRGKTAAPSSIEEMTVDELRAELAKLDHAIAVFDAPPAVAGVPTPPVQDHGPISLMRERREAIRSRLEN